MGVPGGFLRIFFQWMYLYKIPAQSRQEREKSGAVKNEKKAARARKLKMRVQCQITRDMPLCMKTPGLNKTRAAYAWSK